MKTKEVIVACCGLSLFILVVGFITDTFIHVAVRNKPAPSGIPYTVVVIDGCEYVSAYIHGFSHKGNCTNSIHIYNAERK